MSNEVVKTPKGLKNLLAGKKAKKAETEPEKSEKKEPEKKKVVTAASEPVGDPFLIKPLPDGNLMKLWANWATSVPRPELSFACGGRETELFGGERELIMEGRLMMTRIEQDAQRTLRLIEKLLKLAEKGEEHSFDASCIVYRSKNQMAAWLFLVPAWGRDGKYDEAVIDTALKSNGIVYGIDEEALAQVKEKPSYLTLIPIAFGTPVVLGQDGKVNELYPRYLPKQIQVDKFGNADYRIGNFVQAIRQGQVICEIIAPVYGTPGTTIEGKVVEPPVPKPARVPAGQNTGINPDGTQLVALMDGNLEFSGKGFTVKPVLSVNGDVDFNIGNIDMLGDVHVRGDVREGFTVRASGNIIVEGMVESANVEAGGDIVVVRGIVGNNSAFVKAGGHVRAKFMENCIVYAGQSVIAECILSSTVGSDDTVEALNGRGTIIGGVLTVARSVKARVIGSELGMATKITLGILPYVQSKLESIHTDLAAIERELNEIEKNLTYFENNPQPGVEAKAANARLRKSVLLMRQQKHLDQCAEFEAMTPDIALCKLEASTVHPQTTVTIGRYSWCSEETKEHCTLIYDRNFADVVQV